MTATPHSSSYPEAGHESTGASVAEGDRAAARGDWPSAVGIWQGLLEGNERNAAIERIQWFLDEADSAQTDTAGFQLHCHGARFLLSIAFTSGALATATVLVARGESGATALTLASVAWLLYAVSAALAVVYAYRTGRTSRRQPGRLTPDEVVRSAQLAGEIGTSGGDESSAS